MAGGTDSQGLAELASGLGALALAIAAWIGGHLRSRSIARRAQPEFEQTQVFFDGPLEAALKLLRSCEGTLSRLEEGIAAVARHQHLQNERIEDQARDQVRTIQDLRDATNDQIKVLGQIRDILDGWHKGQQHSHKR